MAKFLCPHILIRRKCRKFPEMTLTLSDKKADGHCDRTEEGIYWMIKEMVVLHGALNVTFNKYLLWFCHVKWIREHLLLEQMESESRTQSEWITEYTRGNCITYIYIFPPQDNVDLLQYHMGAGKKGKQSKITFWLLVMCGKDIHGSNFGTDLSQHCCWSLKLLEEEVCADHFHMSLLFGELTSQSLESEGAHNTKKNELCCPRRVIHWKVIKIKPHGAGKHRILVSQKKTRWFYSFASFLARTVMLWGSGILQHVKLLTGKLKTQQKLWLSINQFGLWEEGNLSIYIRVTENIFGLSLFDFVPKRPIVCHLLFARLVPFKCSARLSWQNVDVIRFGIQEQRRWGPSF